MVVPPQRQATVTLTMGGTVHATTLLPGDYVKKGSVIVSLENPDFITLQQTYLDAHAQTEYLEAEYKRQQRLSEQEAASQKRFQQSKADYLSMKSRQDAAAANLLILRCLRRRSLEDGIQPYLEVKAPLSGYVAGLSINLGKYVNAGEPICDVIDKGETLLCLTAYEKDLADLSIGNQVQFRVNGMGKETFHAVLISIDRRWTRRAVPGNVRSGKRDKSSFSSRYVCFRTGREEMTIFAFMKKMNIKNKYVFSLVIISIMVAFLIHFPNWCRCLTLPGTTLFSRIWRYWM